MSIGRLNYWISRNALNADEIDSNRFLKAACRYGDTTIQYGRDRYSLQREAYLCRLHTHGAFKGS